MGETALVSEVVRVRGLRKSYRKRLAVGGVDLMVQRGEIFGLIGPDGAGKSSLMKTIAGVLAFDAGDLEVFGVRLDSEAAAERIKHRLGFMPQGLGLNLYPELSVEENVDFFARLRLVADQELAERKAKLLAMTRLDKFRDRPMKQLSGGMKQKLGLVCTLIHEPALIVLDEPTTGVDPVSRRDFWMILSELVAEKGITALVSTVYMDEASRFHRMAMLHGGNVLATGTPESIRALAPGSQVLVEAEQPLAALARLRSTFPQVEMKGAYFSIFVDEAEAGRAKSLVQAALSDLKYSVLEVDAPELEDGFIALLRRRGLVSAVSEAPTPASSQQAAPTPQQGSETAIEARALTRDFGAFRAVDNVSFRVSPGEIFGLLGANGAGKTTVIKMLTGILVPSAGSGQVAGGDVRTGGAAIKACIGYMSQAFSLYLDLSVMENIRLYGGIYGLGATETRHRARWVIEMAGLGGHETERPADLSMGMRQRLALGCALVHRPQVLFLDEPTSGVDPVGRRRFWDILFRLAREENVAILVTTHYMSEAEHCDRLALMYAGRIVADAPPATLKHEVEKEAGRLLELTVADAARALALLRGAGYSGAYLHGDRVRLLSRDPEGDSERIRTLLEAAGLVLPAASIRTRSLSMEDVFVYQVTALERAAQGAPA
ncbi:ABC transporter ATP-binding protein [Thiohalobacter sp. COW1]|uniref:ATP-binding cassette domain-containing protein n=1 Tax=Thiohalobacter sp. COW1 TaxID=2795687 RepID=UPI0019156E63|nr:ATP-binding cassette domain-containing protein [Thiohalobacter sp. COW1]BCO31281.1 ABC transporter ATP-binding protein [Thiohalobacter sp. COW1]